MTISCFYWLFRHVFGLAVLRCRSDGANEVEILVLRHETYSAASSTSTKPQRDNRRSGFRHPQALQTAVPGAPGAGHQDDQIVRSERCLSSAAGSRMVRPQ